MAEFSRRLPIYLLIDCSESMAGPAIDSVTQGVNSLVTELRNNPLALESAVLSVITFSKVAKQVVPLSDPTDFMLPRLVIRPGTALGSAIEVLINCLDHEIVTTTESKKGDYRPLVFLLTDGQPTDQWTQAADKLKALKTPKIANIYAIGFGPDVDFGVLNRISDIVLSMPEVSPETFRKFFVWLSASIQKASESISGKDDGNLIDLTELPVGVLEVARQLSLQQSSLPRQVFLHARCSRTKKPYLMRFGLSSQAGYYNPIAAHRLEAIEPGDADLLPPISSTLLNGCPACPHCGNPGAAMCICGAILCFPANETTELFCPGCNGRLLGTKKGRFNINQSPG